MKYQPADEPFRVGLFQFDGTESLAEIKAEVLARREAIHPNRSWNDYFTEVKTPRSWKPATARPIKEGDGQLRHDVRTAAAVALCEKHGVEFWALGRNTSFVWGVVDGRYVEVWSSGVHEPAA